MKSFFNRGVLDNIIAMIGGSSLQAVFGFVTNLILVRFISPENFGVFAMVLANAYLLSSFFNLRVNELVIRDSKEELEVKLPLYGKYVLFQSCCITFCGFLLIYWSKYWNYHALFLLVAMFLNPIASLQIAIYERKMQYAKIATIELTANLIGNLISLIGVFSGLGVVVLYLRILTGPIVKIIGLIKLQEHQKIPIGLIKFTEIISIAKTAKGFWIDAIAEQSFDRILYILIGQLLPIQVIGFFYQAKLFIGIPHRLFSSFTSRLSYNYLSQKGCHIHFLRNIIKWEMAVLIPMAVLCFFGAKEIILFFYGDAWIETSTILIYMSPLIFFYSLFSTLKVFHMAKKRMRYFLIWARLPSYIIFLGGFFLIEHFLNSDQVYWLAFTLALSYGVSCFSLILAQRKIFFKDLAEN